MKKQKIPRTNKKRLEDLRLLLEDKRSEILRKNSTHNVLDKGIARGDLADLSNDLHERELMLELAEHDRNTLLEIDQALNMIDSGSYGICDECGNAINQARLLAVPTATLCIDCQSQFERTNTKNY